MEITSIQNGQFNGNILVVGRSGCEKTTSLEKLGFNKFFGGIIKTEWNSGIDIDKKREAEVESYFNNETKVHIAKEPNELDSLIETFKLRSHDKTVDKNITNNSFGENKHLDRLIVMVDVFGVADVSKKFANFLTILRKFGYNCVYVFHVITPSTQIWQKITSQTNIFNIFSPSVPQNTVWKIIQSNCVSQTKKYVPVRSLWLNSVFTDLANSHEKHCLTSDCGYINKNGPGRYRSSAENPEKQVCFFNKPNDDEYYNVFKGERIKGENFDERIYFKIEKVRGKTDKENFGAKRTLRMAQIMLDEANFSLIQNQSRLEQEQKEMAIILSTFTEEAESQEDQNFFQDDNVISKKKKRTSNYSNTKVKARNLLTNVSHRRFKQSDFNSASFIIDILSFLVQNFNPINLDIKLDIDKERDMVKLLWEECIPHDFIRYIYKAENYTSISNP